MKTDELTGRSANRTLLQRVNDIQADFNALHRRVSNIVHDRMTHRVSLKDEGFVHGQLQILSYELEKLAEFARSGNAKKQG